MLKGQGATEYLILFAAVLIVAISTVSLLGFFSGNSGEVGETQSQLYWQTAKPFRIMDAKAHLQSFTLAIQNTREDPLTLTQVKVNGNATVFSSGQVFDTGATGNITISPGKTATITFPTAARCTNKDGFLSASLVFIYDSPYMPSLQQIGEKKVVAKCSGENCSANGDGCRANSDCCNNNCNLAGGGFCNSP